MPAEKPALAFLCLKEDFQRMAKFKNAEKSSLEMFCQYSIKSFSPLMLHSIIYSNRFIEIVLNPHSF